jgi:hypothetical protein
MNWFKQSTLVRTIVAVLWSFLGIRKGAEFQKDIERITPLHVMIVGVIAALLFVVTLIVLVNWVVAS